MTINIQKMDVIWSYIGNVVSMGSNLIMLPFILYYLDGDMLGLWYIFSSIGSIAGLFDCGFSVTFGRNITYCWSGARELKKNDVSFVSSFEPDYSLVKKVLYACKWIYFLLSFVALLLLLTGGTAYIVYISKSISGFTPVLAWIIYATACFLNLYYGYYASFLRGVGAVKEANQNMVIARSIHIILTIVLLYFGFGLMGTSIAYLTYGVIFRCLGKYRFYRFQNLGKNLKKIHDKYTIYNVKEIFLVVWYNAWRDGIISICNYLCVQASTIVCSFYLTLGETGMYSLGVQLATAIATISGTLYNTYQPALQEAYITQNHKKMRKTMSIIVMSFVYLFIVGTIGTVVVGLPLLRIIRPSVIVSASILVGLCIYQFILKFRNCYTSYFSCTNRIVYVKSFIVSSVFCVLLLIVFGHIGWGIWGFILAQIISQVYNFIIWPYRVHKEMSLPLKKMANDGNKLLKQAIFRY